MGSCPLRASGAEPCPEKPPAQPGGRRGQERTRRQDRAKSDAGLVARVWPRIPSRSVCLVFRSSAPVQTERMERKMERKMEIRWLFFLQRMFATTSNDLIALQLHYPVRLIRRYIVTASDAAVMRARPSLTVPEPYQNQRYRMTATLGPRVFPSTPFFPLFFFFSSSSSSSYFFLLVPQMDPIYRHPPRQVDIPGM